MHYDIFCENLRRGREESNLSREKLGKKIGKDSSVIFRLSVSSAEKKYQINLVSGCRRKSPTSVRQ